MMTDISFSPSFYNFETDSSSSQISSSSTNHSYVLQPQQTQNLKSLLAHGIVRRTDGLPKDANYRPPPFYDTMNGTQDTKAKGEGHDVI